MSPELTQLTTHDPNDAFCACSACMSDVPGWDAADGARVVANVESFENIKPSAPVVAKVKKSGRVPFDSRVIDAARQGLFVPGVSGPKMNYYYRKLDGGEGYVLEAQGTNVLCCDCPAFLNGHEVIGEITCKHKFLLESYLLNTPKYQEIQALLAKERKEAFKAAKDAKGKR